MSRLEPLIVYSFSLCCCFIQSVITIQLSIKQPLAINLIDSFAWFYAIHKTQGKTPPLDQYKWYGFDDVLFRKRSKSPHLARENKKKGKKNLYKASIRKKQNRRENYTCCERGEKKAKKKQKTKQSATKSGAKEMPIKNEICQDYFLQSERFFST